MRVFMRCGHYFPCRSVGKVTVEEFAPPPRQEGMEELEHYKLQMKIMTDLINVNMWEGIWFVKPLDGRKYI